MPKSWPRSTSSAPKPFTYKYKVSEVVMRGFFKANVDDGEGNTLTAEEAVDVFALARGQKCSGGAGKCPLLRSGSLTLRHPPTARRRTRSASSRPRSSPASTFNATQQLYGEVYPIALFRRPTVTLEIDSEYEWKPNETTKLRGALAGYVELKRL